MTTVKAIAFDLDDTLLRGDRSISAYTLSVLRRAAQSGVHIIPASGRTRESMRAYVERLGCASAFIACNGAECYGADFTLWHQETLPVPLAHEAARFAAEEHCYAQTYRDDRFFYSMHGEYAEQYAESSSLRGTYVGDLTAFIREPVTKILLMDSSARIAELLALARARFEGRASLTCSKPYFLEINPLRATKGNALRFLGERLGFSMAEAAAFGDSLNDLSMLEAVQYGVAMANARPDVLARVPRHCGDNEHDGVAAYVESYLLKEEHP